MTELEAHVVALMNSALDPDLKARAVIDAVVSARMDEIAAAAIVEHNREIEREKKRRQRAMSRDKSAPVPGQSRDTNRVSNVSSTRARDLGSDLDLRSVDPIRSTGADAAPNPFTDSLTHFGAAWKGRYGIDYRPTAADRNQLGRLIQGLGASELAQLPALFRAYVADSDPFLVERVRHSLAHFCTGGGLNKYRAAPAARKAAVKPADGSCPFHTGGKNSERAAPTGAELETCGECRHAKARARRSWSESEPTPISELLAGERGKQ